MFKSSKVYIQIFRNRITAINLETGEKASKNAEQPFSSVRQVLGNFNNAHATLQMVFKELGIQKTFAGIKAVILQMEGTEGGLSDIEKRALREVAEHAGVDRVYLVEQEKELSAGEALQIIKNAE